MTHRTPSPSTRTSKNLAPWQRLLFGPHFAARKQRVRVLRFLIAAASYLLLVGLAGIGTLAGFTPLDALIDGSAAVAACLFAVYVLFRTGLNRRLRDPSLTLLQIITAVGGTSYLLYHSGDARTVYILLHGRVPVRRLPERHLYCSCWSYRCWPRTGSSSGCSCRTTRET